jgi:hypothetical protein
LATRVFDEKYPSLELYCSDGLPINYNTQVESSNQRLGYGFHGISPTDGFTGGTLLTVHTRGFGKNTDVSGAALAYYDGNEYEDFCTNF